MVLMGYLDKHANKKLGKNGTERVVARVWEVGGKKREQRSKGCSFKGRPDYVVSGGVGQAGGRYCSTPGLEYAIIPLPQGKLLTDSRAY
jgi:hypothetical protein